MVFDGVVSFSPAGETELFDIEHPPLLFLWIKLTGCSPQPQHTNVCFWYIPPGLRGMPDGDERREKLHRVRNRYW